MSHGVMLSDPPPLASSQSPSPSASRAILTSSGTLLHKGVMLSVRPASSVLDPQGRPAAGPGLNPPPFITGGRHHDQIGYPPIPNPALILQRKRTTTLAPAMRKHRRWLDDLRHERDRLDDERRRQQAADQTRLRNFKERSALIRRRICQAIKGEGNELTPVKAERLFTAPLSELKRQEEEEKQEKPAWSMTEDEGERQSRSQIEDLIEFTRDLDLGRYIDDLEIQQLIRTVQKRITDLNQDEGGDFRSDTEAARYRRLAEPAGQQDLEHHREIISQQQSSNNIVMDSAAADNDKRMERIVEESLATFKQIHSRTSLRSIIDSMERRENPNPSCSVETTGARDLDLNDLPNPKIVQVDGNHIGRIPADKQAAHISTLPYLHRNPAV